MSAHDPEEPADRARPVSHDQVDHEPERTDRDDSDPGDQDDLRVLVRRRLAGHLEYSPESAFPEPLHPLLDPPLDLPAPVYDVRHGPHRTMSTPAWGARRCSPGPRICFDFTPVKMSMTRSLCSRLGSTAAPQMMRAFAAMRPWTISDTFSASATLMSFPPVTLTRAPVAWLMSTSIRGELIASSIASSERLSRSDSPRPIIATPPPFMIVLMSLKSRFTRPGFVMTSVIPLMPRISTSSATLNAAFKARRGTSSRSLSFGITTTVSAKFRSFSRPYSAFSARMAPSARNGNVQIAIVRAPASFDKDWKSTRLNSSHVKISYAVFCLKKKKNKENIKYS